MAGLYGGGYSPWKVNSVALRRSHPGVAAQMREYEKLGDA